MNNLLRWLFVGLLSYLSPTFATEVPTKLFSIDGATVGVTTLEDIQKAYGVAKPVRKSKEDESDVELCYVRSSESGKTYLMLESGVMGESKRITGYRISAIRSGTGCTKTGKPLENLVTANGIRLGVDLKSFRKALPVHFKERGEVLSYENVSRRTATPEELKQIRAKWPNERQDYFDVTTVVTARFKQNKLVDLYVRKIESY